MFHGRARIADFENVYRSARHIESVVTREIRVTHTGQESLIGRLYILEVLP